MKSVVTVGETVEYFATTNTVVVVDTDNTGAGQIAAALAQAKADLAAEVTAVEALNQAQYKTATWTALQTALTAAKTTAANTNATTAQLNQARTDLTAAKTALVKRASVDATKFVLGTDNANGTADTIKGNAGAIVDNTAGLTVTAYQWTDANSNGVVDAGELGAAIALGTTAADGSVAEASIGDKAPGTYKFVITVTDEVESVQNATAVTTITLAN
ncbi:hypothetical protein [Metabacillus fastidiosus]|uniref:hypothetical protein n=1 Tax=Metabacillus fastidiosus TaxID=1458 RepID=UPI0014713184|nr:hypothetical protein [Metabacillus fastidiosus]MED4464480.1 hypothetical protein [Metabacillus fastidiosus]